MHNISFDVSQHRVVQLRIVTTLNVYVSLTSFEKQVIVFEVCKNLAALDDATRAYVKSTSLSVWFLIAENERMAKELQATKKGGE